MSSGKQEAIVIMRIKGMGKPGRAQRLRRTAQKLDGLLQLDINYILDSVTIKYDADKLTLVQIEKKLDLVGAQKK